jgi:hypothetical protein
MDFMLRLLRKPYAYPEEKLTRGMVAKLLCNYLGTVPMKNDQVFSDVPVSHDYSPYIWAMNRLGIMNGNGDGTFRPDSELSMQEFAVMAERLIQYEKAKAVELSKNWRDTNPFMDVYTPEEIADIDAEYKKRAEEGFDPPVGSLPKIFADNNQIASWAKPAVDEFSRWGILEGDSSGSSSHLHPTEPLSKTRFLVFLYKFDQKLDLDKTIYNTPTPLF